MEAFIDLEQRIKTWFADYEVYIMPVIRFFVMLAVLLLMNWHLGYRLLLMRWVLVILVSLVCALLPWSGMTALAGIYLLGHVSALSWEAAVVLGVLMFIAVLLHYLFLPGASFLIVIVPLAYYLRIPYLVPLLAGLFGGGLAFIPTGLGVAMYYMMNGLERNAQIFLDPARSIQEQFLTAIGILRSSRAMVVAVAAFCLVTLAVYGIRKLSIDYVKYMAVAAGAILMLVVHIVGSMIMDLTLSYMTVLIGCVISALIAVLIVLWCGQVDYSRPEYLQFEDDEYIYYVKAVPKIVLERPEKELMTISGRDRAKEKERPAGGPAE